MPRNSTINGCSISLSTARSLCTWSVCWSLTHSAFCKRLMAQTLPVAMCVATNTRENVPVPMVGPSLKFFKDSEVPIRTPPAPATDFHITLEIMSDDHPNRRGRRTTPFNDYPTLTRCPCCRGSGSHTEQTTWGETCHAALPPHDWNMCTGPLNRQQTGRASRTAPPGTLNNSRTHQKRAQAYHKQGEHGSKSYR